MQRVSVTFASGIWATMLDGVLLDTTSHIDKKSLIGISKGSG